MEVEATVYVEEEPLEETEAKLMERIKRLQKVPRNVVLAYAGFWGMAYDEAKALVERSQEVFDRAEDRGEALESDAVERARKLYKRAEAEVEEEVQEQVGEALDEFDLPTQERINRLARKLDTLDRKLDVMVAQEAAVEAEVGQGLVRLEQATEKRLLALEAKLDLIMVQETAVEAEVGEGLGRLEQATEKRLRRVEEKLDRLAGQVEQAAPAEAEEAATAPLPGYDQLTAKEIVKKLPELTIARLETVRAYESAHEDRVTVLRDVDSRIEAMPIAHYDELTVDEIEPMLATLETAELTYLAEYEAAHEDRVTLLRAIEDEVEARAEA